VGFADLLAVGDRLVRTTLGETVTYTSGVGVVVSVAGVFDQAYVKSDLGQVGVSSSGPAVFLTLADLPSDPMTDAAATVVVRGKTFTAYEVQPDGQGAVLLLLHEV
jgi:hypothetical protein